MKKTIECKNVSIAYKYGDFKDIGLKEWVLRHIRNNYQVSFLIADDNISFDLYEGDMLGIIGVNGAGKSTLLKAIAGVMKPKKGSVITNGKISALLELTAGFDNDLNLKENIYLRGALLGYTREYINQKYDEIIDFAGLREFEDRPYKQLSSGMKSRLAFSVSSLVNPDILILDEVLSVGDGAFREKSAKKIKEIINNGATTIFVSHSLEDIRTLCNKVLWIDKGKQIEFGETKDVCDKYQAFLNKKSN